MASPSYFTPLAEIAHFRTHGWLKAEQRIPTELLDSLRSYLDELFSEQTDGAQRGFAGLKYDLDHPSISAIREQPAVRELLYSCADFVPVCTQAIAFEVTSSTRGFPWHIDTLSNNYIMPDDQGCTLWIPVEPICRAVQDGGMRWVSTDVWRGDYATMRRRYSVTSDLVPEIVEAEVLASQAAREAPGGQHDNYYGVTKAQTMVLDELCESCDFDFGDCLLFSKFMWHRSAPLHPGPMSSRRALVFRFVDFQSRYSKLVCDGTRKTYTLESDYGVRFSELEDGELLRRSPYFPPPF